LHLITGIARRCARAASGQETVASASKRGELALHLRTGDSESED
jgi:hypothetical protein